MAQFKESLVINRVYKYELRLNNHERSLLRRCEGLSRFTWNWALAERLKGFNTQKGKQKFTTAIAQHRDLNKLKQTEFMWMYKYSKCIPQESLRDLERGMQNFQRNRTQRQVGRTRRYVGFPRFKKKGRCRESFRLTCIICICEATKRIQLPRLGKLRLKERLAYNQAREF